MPDKKMNEFIFQVGELTGATKSLNKATEINTAEIKKLSDYMQQNIGATEERDKSYKRMKHTSVGSVCIAVSALLKAFLGHS